MLFNYTYSSKVLDMIKSEKSEKWGNRLYPRAVYREACAKYEYELADEAIAFLKENNIIEKSWKTPEAEIIKLRQIIGAKFRKEWTSISPAMERLLYYLSAYKDPSNLFAAGIFWGNTMIWNTGPACIGEKYAAREHYGIEICPKATALAVSNFEKIANTKHIIIENRDAVDFIKKTDRTFDYIYLDAESEEEGKNLYYIILEIAYKKLNKGGWVLAHDINHEGFKKDFEKYLSFVRDGQYFKHSINFDLDDYGLELSIK